MRPPPELTNCSDISRLDSSDSTALIRGGRPPERRRHRPARHPPNPPNPHCARPRHADHGRFGDRLRPGFGLELTDPFDDGVCSLIWGAVFVSNTGVRFVRNQAPNATCSSMSRRRQEGLASIRVRRTSSGQSSTPYAISPRSSRPGRVSRCSGMNGPTSIVGIRLCTRPAATWS